MTKHEFEEFKLCIARLFDAKKSDFYAMNSSLWRRETQMSENNHIPTRGAALLDAHALINGERQQAYGEPEDCFSDIAVLWNWWTQRRTATGELSASDVAMMMALFKIARERCGAGKRDNIIDATAYLALYEDIKQLGGGDETR